MFGEKIIRKAREKLRRQTVKGMGMVCDELGVLRSAGREVVPRFAEDRRGEVIQSCHVGTGHGGVNSTFARVREGFLGVTKVDVEKHVSRCTECLHTNAKTLPKGEMTLIEVTQPWEHVVIDLANFSFVKGKNRGFCWILCVVDHFSRYENSVSCVCYLWHHLTSATDLPPWCHWCRSGRRR